MFAATPPNYTLLSCRALAGQFTESKTKLIELHLEKAPGEEVRGRQGAKGGKAGL